jgi:hypothetical protein
MIVFALLGVSARRGNFDIRRGVRGRGEDAFTRAADAFVCDSKRIDGILDDAPNGVEFSSRPPRKREV